MRRRLALVGKAWRLEFHDEEQLVMMSVISTKDLRLSRVGGKFSVKTIMVGIR
jgi:hypothetical protein